MADGNQMIIRIGANTDKLRADLALAQADVTAFGKELRAAAAEARDTNDYTKVEELAGKYEDARGSVARLNGEIRNAKQTTEGEAKGGWLATAHEAFGKLREHMEPLKEHFSQLRERAEAFKESLAHTASSIIPHFEEVLGLATIGGAAGFLKMVDDVAEWSHSITEATERLGITKSELLDLAKAAKESGIDVEHLIDGMSKFAFKSQEALDAQKKVVLGIATKTSGDERTEGLPEVLRGGSGSGSTDGVRVLRGNANQGDVTQRKPQFEPILDENGKKIGERALATGKLIRSATVELGKYTDDIAAWFNKLSKEGQAPANSVQQWIGKINNVLSEGGGAAKAMRQELAKVGIELPALTKGEQFERMQAGFTDLFTKMHIGLIKTNGETKSVSESFVDFAKKVEGASSAQERAQLIQKALGRGYNDLIPTLTKIAKAADEAEKKAALSELSGGLKEHKVDTSALDKEIEKGDELWLSLKKLDLTMKSLQRTFVIPFADVFTPLVNDVQKALEANKGKVQAFARDLAASIRPYAEDFARVLAGGKAETGLGKFFQDLPSKAQTAFAYIQALFEKLIGFADRVASAINGIFGTNFSGKGLLIAGVIIHLTGILPTLTSGIWLAVAAFNALRFALVFFLTNPIGLTLAAIGLVALTIYQNWDKIAPLFQSIWDLMKQFGTWVSTEFKAFWDDPITYIKGAITGLLIYVTGEMEKFVKDLEAIGSKAKSIATSIASAIGGGKATSATGGGVGATLSSGPSFSPAATATVGTAGGDLDSTAVAGGYSSGFASGGYFKGMGTGTSDSNIARVSNGEFIVNAASTSRHLQLLHAINSGIRGFAMGGLVGDYSPSLPSFAGGGLVGSGGEHWVNLSHGGGPTWRVKADANTAQSMVRYARGKQLSSTGSKPLWAGT